MFCGTEAPLEDPFASVQETDPLSCPQTQSESSDEEPNAKRPKIDYSPSLNLKVYQIPPYNGQKNDFTIYPTNTSALPTFVNNPLNLANPLALNAFLNKPFQPQNRHSLPNLVKAPSIPVNLQNPNKSLCENGEVVRYKKNGEVAKKRGPPKGYKRKPKTDVSAIQTLTNNLILQAQNTILTSLLASTSGLLTKEFTKVIPQNITVPSTLTIVPKIKVPHGVEPVELDLDPADWYPEEPYKWIFSRKKNPKWKQFPYRCEHCFKGYRVASTLVAHSAERHGTVPNSLAIPCPCCPHVSTRRKHHKKHLEEHSSRKGRLFCVYCLPLQDTSEKYVKESERFPFDKFPQFWYASEESLRLHKKRKHPYAAMYNYNWFGTWGDVAPNS